MTDQLSELSIKRQAMSAERSVDYTNAAQSLIDENNLKRYSFNNLATRELKREAGRTTTRWNLSRSEQRTIGQARDFILKRRKELGIKKDLPRTKAFIFTDRYRKYNGLSAVAGRAYPWSRMFGIHEEVMSIRRTTPKVGIAVHEIAHATAKVTVKQSRQTPYLIHPISNSRLEVMQNGWSTIGSRLKTEPFVWFTALEECASTLFELDYYKSRGGVETQVKHYTPYGRPPERGEIHPERVALARVHAYLYGQHKYDSFEDYNSFEDEAKRRGWANTLRFKPHMRPQFNLLGISVEGLSCYSDISRPYGSLIAYLDKLAPKLYPEMEEKKATVHFREEIQRVQAEGGHARIWKRLTSALGKSGAKFIASLTYDTYSLALLDMYFDADRVLELEKSMLAKKAIEKAGISRNFDFDLPSDPFEQEATSE